MSERIVVNVTSEPYEASSYDVSEDRHLKGTIDGFHVALLTKISKEMRAQAFELVAGHLWAMVWPDFKEHGKNPPETLLMIGDSQQAADSAGEVKQ